MTAAEPTALSYLARRGVAPQWRMFLRALVETLDANLDAASRDALLRAVGARFGALAPLPPCGGLAELEARMNEVLAAADWGWVEIALDPGDRTLVLMHCAAPAVATGADPSGGWIAAVLEGTLRCLAGGAAGRGAELYPTPGRNDGGLDHPAVRSELTPASCNCGLSKIGSRQRRRASPSAPARSRFCSSPNNLPISTAWSRCRSTSRATRPGRSSSRQPGPVGIDPHLFPPALEIRAADGQPVLGEDQDFDRRAGSNAGAAPSEPSTSAASRPVKPRIGQAPRVRNRAPIIAEASRMTPATIRMPRASRLRGGVQTASNRTGWGWAGMIPQLHGMAAPSCHNRIASDAPRRREDAIAWHRPGSTPGTPDVGRPGGRVSSGAGHAQSGAGDGAALQRPLHLAGGGGAFGPDDRCRGEQGDARPVRRRARRRPRWRRWGPRGSRRISAASGCGRARRGMSPRCPQLLVEQHGGEVPGDRAALEALPGVGRKTANVVLNVAFGESTMAVDTHIFRLGNRTGLGPRQDAARGRGRAGEALPAGDAARRASLADPARPLRLQGAAAGVLALPGRGALQLPRQGCCVGLMDPLPGALPGNRCAEHRVGIP